MVNEKETTSAMSLTDKIEALEKRVIELELRNKTAPLIEAALALNDATAKGVDETKAQSGDPKDETGEEKPTSRVKVIVTTRNPETGEPIEKEKNVDSKNKEIDQEKFAFILRKNIYEHKFHTPNGSEIDVISKDLWKLLKKYLSHFPYHIFRKDPVTLKSPYDHIVFQFDDLLAEAERADEDEENKQARNDLKLLLDTISTSSGDEKLDKYFKLRPNYKKQKPVETVQFDDLWTAFPPGMLVYGRPFQNEHQVFVVKDNQLFWPWRGSSMRNYTPWALDAWSYDWKDGTFNRTLFTLLFEHFDGQLPLTSLPYYPFELHPDRDKIEKELIKRGQKFRKVCTAKDGERLFEYQGNLILEQKGFSGIRHDEEADDELRSATSIQMADIARLYGLSQSQSSESDAPVQSVNIKSRVMVDYDAFFQYGRADGRNGALKPSTGRSGCGCQDCQTNKGLTTRYRTGFDDRRFAKSDESWFDEQYLICPPRVLGYILQQKQWAQLEVNRLKSLETENQATAWESRLRLADDVDASKRRGGKKVDENSTKSLLLDLVHTHAMSETGKDAIEDEDDKLEVNDIISGKGKGLVILLYGPPGVGKTSTAETIAIATRKPLFSISVADVGTRAKHVEANLQRVFDLATKWQAILLIDEADVFLESRGRGNLIRSTDKNALVSVFLRVLEYYQGIMFLTTNQITEFDIAIPSRIHVAIKYESLKEKQMQAIFTGFLDELDDKCLIDGYDEIKDWLEEVVYKENFDGRQIRNIVKTALGLARADSDRGSSGRLKKSHMKRAFANVNAFKRDFNTQMQRYIDGQQKMIK